MSKPLNLHSGVGIIATRDDGKVLIAYGPTVPADTSSGYSTGCLFLHTDGGDGTALYVNEGTAASCDFNAVNP